MTPCNFIIGDLVETTTKVMCPVIAEEAAHADVTFDAVHHNVGSVTIHRGDVLKLVRALDARHGLFRISGMLVCLSTKHLTL